MIKLLKLLFKKGSKRKRGAAHSTLPPPVGHLESDENPIPEDELPLHEGHPI